MNAVISMVDRRPPPALAPRGIVPGDVILRLKAVTACVSMSRATIYRRIAEGKFPPQVSLGGTSVGWRKSDIDLWIAGLWQGGEA